MNLIIQGDDKRKAKKWIQFAKNKLRQIKTFTPGPMLINEYYTPASGILVHIKAVNGIDTIRIETEGGKYMCDFPVVDRYPIPHSDFQLRCPVRPKGVDEFLRIGFLSRSNNINDPSMGGDWDTYTWDFGDGNFDTGASVFHEYDEPGEYTVSLTVAKDIVETFISGNSAGGERKEGGDDTILSPYLKANSAVAYANYQASAPGIFNNSYEWIGRASNKGTYVGINWLEDISFSYTSQNVSWNFDLTSVDVNAIVTVYMNLFLQDQVCNTPAHGDACYTSNAGQSAVVSSAGGSGTPGIDINPINMGDISGSIGGMQNVTFTDTGGNSHFVVPTPGTWPEPNRNAHFTQLGVYGSDPWAIASEPTSSLKTTKVIKVYTGRRGHKRSFQVGDSVHT
jgi:hypothetical protein